MILHQLKPFLFLGRAMFNDYHNSFLSKRRKKKHLFDEILTELYNSILTELYVFLSCYPIKEILTELYKLKKGKELFYFFAIPKKNMYLPHQNFNFCFSIIFSITTIEWVLSVKENVGAYYKVSLYIYTTKNSLLRSLQYMMCCRAHIQTVFHSSVYVYTPKRNQSFLFLLHGKQKGKLEQSWKLKQNVTNY